MSPRKEKNTVPKIDESRMAERPEGVSEKSWRAKLEYEAVQQQQAREDMNRTSYEAKEASNKILGR